MSKILMLEFFHNWLDKLSKNSRFVVFMLVWIVPYGLLNAWIYKLLPMNAGYFVVPIMLVTCYIAITRIIFVSDLIGKFKRTLKQ